MRILFDFVPTVPWICFLFLGEGTLKPKSIVNKKALELEHFPGRNWASDNVICIALFAWYRLTAYSQSEVTKS